MTNLKGTSKKMTTMIITAVLSILGTVAEIYEIKNETKEDKKKKIWLFEH